MKSCSSGGIAWRRKVFRNSRVNGAPLTVFKFESIVIACICVGVCGAWLGGFAAALVIDLVAGLLAGTGGLAGTEGLVGTEGLAGTGRFSLLNDHRSCSSPSTN